MTFTLGSLFRIHVFGESHGHCIGVTVEGCPPGLPVSVDLIQSELDRRRPGDSPLFTSRSEPDVVEIHSGVFNGHSTGGPIMMMVRNLDCDSSHYEMFRDVPRPGHADYAARVKYRGYNDHRGGGFLSGRITAAFVMAGAIAKSILALRGVEVLSHAVQIGRVRLQREVSDEEIRSQVYSNAVRCADARLGQEMERSILEAMREHDSIGGVVECRILNVPVGVGEPIFNSLESCLSHAVFSIPAVKGIEFGAGFASSLKRGSQNNDAMTFQDDRVVWTKNDAGGILGGISTGAPIVFRVAIKPTPSIGMTQRSVNLRERRDVTISVSGRHDPCIVPRAVPVVASLAAVTIVDLLTRKECSLPQ
ncbi:MAG: chorismate synthase [Candidatus Thorarchaeota archaeon]|nr:chorismate synthase [Candidatus Thorarchaeota archaeon]